jgi:NAD(P)-dependent dehydrogenase (short-subunit alcohol dehydrogenase family)
MATPTGPVAIVTGASTGIGRATALLLARSGYRVFATVRTDEAAASLRAAGAGSALEVVRMDAGDEAQVHRVARDVLARAGRVDVLVNNAGFAQLGSVEDLSRDEIRREFEVNVFGPMHLAREVLPSMRARGSGRIVNVSSLAGRTSVPLMGAYCASKSALEAFSDALRVEARPFGVRVVVVEPGSVRTEFQRAALAYGKRVLESPSPYAGVYRGYLDGGFETDAGASPEQVARAVLRVVRARRPRARVRPRLVDGLIAAFAAITPRIVIDWVLVRWMGLDGVTAKR